MKLYGSIFKSKQSYGRWYFELPEYWSKDKDFIKEHPNSDVVDSTWDDINKDAFEFYQLDIEWMEFDRVLDLRVKDWKTKLLTFVMWYGDGWARKGNFNSSTSPLEHINHLGNYNVLATVGYRWVVCNHGPDVDGNYHELWKYIEIINGPNSVYDMTQLDNKEFLG